MKKPKVESICYRAPYPIDNFYNPWGDYKYLVLRIRRNWGEKRIKKTYLLVGPQKSRKMTLAEFENACVTFFFRNATTAL